MSPSPPGTPLLEEPPVGGEPLGRRLMSDVAIGDVPLRTLHARLGEPVPGEDRELLAEVIAEHDRLVPRRSASRWAFHRACELLAAQGIPLFVSIGESGLDAVFEGADASAHPRGALPGRSAQRRRTES